MDKEIDKAAYLTGKGWYQWYNGNYWCHEQFGERGIDPTNRGMSTDDAYEFETNPASRKETLDSMRMTESAVRCLSNLGAA